MKIRMNKTIGIITILLCIINICIFLVISLGGGKAEITFGLTSLVGIGIGVLFLRGTYIEITQSSLILKALVGSAQKSYPFTSVADFSVEGKNIFLSSQGKREKLPIYSWMADKRDWESFLKWLHTNNTPIA